MTIFIFIGSSMTDLEKMTVLAFDETYLSQKIYYDNKKEQFIGPHKCVLLFVHVIEKSFD